MRDVRSLWRDTTAALRNYHLRSVHSAKREREANTERYRNSLRLLNNPFQADCHPLFQRIAQFLPALQ
jgi:hypothetical protein